MNWLNSKYILKEKHEEKMTLLKKKHVFKMQSLGIDIAMKKAKNVLHTACE